MDWAYLLNSFDGRIGRQTFWLAFGVVMAAEIGGALRSPSSIEGDRLSAIVDLAFTYPEFAVAVKRAHDRNMPVWLVLVFFGAGAFLDLLMVLDLAGTDDAAERASRWSSPCRFTVFGLALLVRARLPQRHARARTSTGPTRWHR